MKRRRQLLDCSEDDRGAALVLVLVVVTVVALAGAALLSFSDTSIRTTVALRDQGAAAYAAEGAAQVAISELQAGSFPNKCATTLTGDGLPLGSTSAFYQSAQSNSTGLNAYVLCTPDPTTGTGGRINSANKPTDAIWTVRSDNKGVGQDYDYGSDKTVNVANGNVISETSIDIGSNTLAVTGAGVKVLAKSSSGCKKNTDGKFEPTACESGATLDPSPSYPAPTDPVSPAPAPVCTSGRSPTYAAFSPGLYTDVDILNGTKKHGNQNDCGKSDVVWFSPGTYYFDFDGTWDAPSRLVGGTPTDSTGTRIADLDPTNASTLTKLSQLDPTSPGACVNPREQSAPGVEFVFGGASRIDLGSQEFEICATYRVDRVPIAIFGPTSAITVNGGTATSPVSERQACAAKNCSLLVMDNDGSAALHIQGFAYAPNARMELALNRSVGQAFHWGLMLGSFQLRVSGPSPTMPFVELPPDSYSVMYLSAYVCPGTATCSAAGTLRLRAKVQLGISVPRTVKVLSWSVQR